MIFYLIYLSSASHLYTHSDLSDVLIKSRSNNTRKNITGLLLYHEGSILQILEGDEAAVLDTYEKIGKDERHHSILKMVTGTTEERNFPDWSMGYKTLSNEEWKEMAGYLKLDSSVVLSRLLHTNRRIDTMINSYMSVNVRG